jgi:hypothetical protein
LSPSGDSDRRALCVLKDAPTVISSTLSRQDVSEFVNVR